LIRKSQSPRAAKIRCDEKRIARKKKADQEPGRRDDDGDREQSAHAGKRLDVVDLTEQVPEKFHLEMPEHWCEVFFGRAIGSLYDLKHWRGVKEENSRSRIVNTYFGFSNDCTFPVSSIFPISLPLACFAKN
jgi:hypothetical protein